MENHNVLNHFFNSSSVKRDTWEHAPKLLYTFAMNNKELLSKESLLWCAQCLIQSLDRQLVSEEEREAKKDKIIKALLKTGKRND